MKDVSPLTPFSLSNKPMTYIEVDLRLLHGLHRPKGLDARVVAELVRGPPQGPGGRHQALGALQDIWLDIAKFHHELWLDSPLHDFEAPFLTL